MLAVETVMEPIKNLIVVSNTLTEQVAALTARVSELEAKPRLRYRGVYDISMMYEAGDFATYDGSAWHCQRPTTDKPGTSDAWQLAIKRGKNGRDAT